MSTQIVTPVGRIVWGHPCKGQIKKDQNTKQPVLRDGQQVEQWAFGLAIPKAEFEAQVWPHMQQESMTIFPNGAPSNFSWKYKDGDSVDKNGKPYSDREGYAGCYVLTISTEAFAPQVFKHENGSYRQMMPEEIKTGDYVAVNLTFVANKPTNAAHTPGIYVNPNGIVHVGYGQEIVSNGGGDPDELFAGAQFAMPAGASAQPTAPSAPIPLPASAPAAQPAGMPAPMPAPAHDFVQNAGMGQPQQGMPAPLPMPLPAGR